jgi:hypothetical protein
MLGPMLGAALLCNACSNLFGWWSGEGSSAPGDVPLADDSAYGAESDVRGTVDIVKTAGEARVLSSHAVHLPIHPLQAITAFDYAFPGVCGGHQFRVYESNGTQILEFAYAPSGGRLYIIRDYVSGPSPFIRAGLWGAYDHTADGVHDMQLRFEQRGSGILKGTYSRGAITDLDASAQRTLGHAYASAIQESYSCRG